ncbi:sulfite exporter TauE/SafE family protein [Gracilibacillus alcaliphilus]|uniref:sulfite exporter TauE/SafE family protein n=1 Tax=Gracilibacillus alcaliphilus TaxID=1401441 RepID=UPI00195DFCBD|nr:sulfite exporter TauE/SafE family protein [Gracilibacillus alcaliphilus]MBM7677486.1 putative membrane protein YfcA [Gracilibacillus alcaliphilus]
METIFFVLIIFIASVLQTSTGFGFSILATPFLLLIFQPMEAIQINLVLSLVISCALIIKIQKDLDIGILKRFIIGSLPGLLLGIYIFLAIQINSLKLAVSIIILLLTVLLMCKWRLRQSNKRDLIVGGLSGTLTTSIGMPGPPLLLYFSGTDTTKETLRATTLGYYLFIYSASLAVQVLFASTNQTVWLSSLLALPIVAAGLITGQLMFKKMSAGFFRLLTYILLLFTGIYLLLESIA